MAGLDKVKAEIGEKMDLPASDLGGRPMAPGENMAPDQAEAARVQALDYASDALKTVGTHLAALKTIGTNSVFAENKMEAMRSTSDKIVNGPNGSLLPAMPGFAYVNHLFKRNQAAKKLKDKKEKKKNEDIYTDHLEALKAALLAMGIYSDRNPGGMPIDIKIARKTFFGDENVDELKEAEWRTSIEMGDRNIDPKKIRKFVNYDGSTTWELLNDDKTVMSRFTMGNFSGKTIFTQGGYAKFADLLERMKGEMGGGGFDAARGALTGL